MTMSKFEPVAYMQISIGDGVDARFPRLYMPKKYNKDWWRFDPLYSADQLTEAYEAGKRDAIPEGYVLAPKEPTKEMMQAGFDVQGSHLYGLTYRAMLAAAPKGEE